MENPCRHLTTKKVDDCTKTPINVGLYRISEALLPFMHATGHTPHLVTTNSVVCKVAMVAPVWVGDWRTFIVTAVLAYFFNCMGYASVRSSVTPLKLFSPCTDETALGCGMGVGW